MPRSRRNTDRKRYRRQQRQDVDWTPQMNALLFALFKQCVVCGRAGQLSKDHVKPLARGGRLEPGNVVILCLSCNAKKCSKPLTGLPVDMADKITKAAALFANEWYRIKGNGNDTGN